MMNRTRAAAVAAMATWVAVPPAGAEVTTYTDESAFLAALGALGHSAVHEGFEDDAAWGAVRSSVGGQHTAPSVTNLGVTWTSSSSNNAVTTSSGAAYEGSWGFYSLPHGDYVNGINDGWRGTGAQPLVAIGGWVRTNTPLAAIVLFLDGDEANAIDFDGDNVLSGPYRFFGVIDPDGFDAFDFRETEGEIDDQKFIFGDEFTFAFAGGCAADLNGDANVDALDFLDLLAQWGTPCAGACTADITGPTPLVPDGNVDALDYLLLIGQWGAPGNCP